MKNQKGFSLIELLVVVIIIAIIAAIAIPSLLASRRAANEASAIGSLRTIHSAQMTYLSVGGTGKFGTFAEIGTGGTGKNLIDSDLTDKDKSGYTFTEAASPTATGYCVSAAPTTDGTTGDRTFAVNHDGVIQEEATAGTAVTCGTFAISNGKPLNNE